MFPVLEAVPNFSEGRDLDLVQEIVRVIAREGADVLDSTSDPDHHRSVVTFVGDPKTVEAAALASARFAMEHIDLRGHDGVHPRVGALDVLPFVPLTGLDLADATRSAHRVGHALAAQGLPVYWYGAASDVSRPLSELRRGGFEALRDGFPPGREADVAPRGRKAPHPSAGVTCVGARPPLLAWNVFVEDVELSDLKALAAELREGGAGGGFASLRTLALPLASTGRLQISMNLEDPVRVSPLSVHRRIQERVAELGGRVSDSEVIGLFPDTLVLPAAADRLRLLDPRSSRLLSARLVDHLAARAHRAVHELLEVIAAAGEEAPVEVREAARRIAGAAGDGLTPEYDL